MSHVKGKSRLLDRFKIDEAAVLAKPLSNDELMVSFLNLPAYIPDSDILAKLRGWGVTAISDIKRRMWPGTHVADGTRFVIVKFTDHVQSLPYSARFNTVLGPEFFRVVHDRQARVCRLCLQPGHVLRDCPDFSCHRCAVQGHYARECPQKQQQGRPQKCDVSTRLPCVSVITARGTHKRAICLRGVCRALWSGSVKWTVAGNRTRKQCRPLMPRLRRRGGAACQAHMAGACVLLLGHFPVMQCGHVVPPRGLL